MYPIEMLRVAMMGRHDQQYTQTCCLACHELWNVAATAFSWLFLMCINLMQAGAAAVSADPNELGSKRPSTTPSGPTPMDTDQTILSSVLGTSGRPDSASAPETAEVSGSAGAYQPASDAVMTDVVEAAQQSAQQGLVGDSMLAESAASTRSSGANESALSQLGSAHEQEVAQLGFAVQLTVQSLRNGAGPTLMPLLVRFLPFLLKTQVRFLHPKGLLHSPTSCCPSSQYMRTACYEAQSS